MHHCKHLKISPTVSGWICFDCFQRFPPDAFPDWVNARIKVLNSLLARYKKCQETRPKQKNLLETIAEIEAELCQLNSDVKISKPQLTKTVA